MRKSDTTFLIDQDILRLDISIHDSIIMEIFESDHDLSSVELRSFLLESLLLTQMSEQLASTNVDSLHAYLINYITKKIFYSDSNT